MIDYYLIFIFFRLVLFLFSFFFFAHAVFFFGQLVIMEYTHTHTWIFELYCMNKYGKEITGEFCNINNNNDDDDIETQTKYERKKTYYYLSTCDRYSILPSSSSSL